MSDESAAQELGKLLRDDAGSEGRRVPDHELARLMRSVSALDARAPRPRRIFPWALVGTLAVAAAVALAVLSVRPDLTFVVRGAARLDDRAISAEAGEPVQVRFSDGSSFQLSPGARMRVEGATADGARLLLQDGQALAHVVHRTGTRWSMHAGPFEVRVVGTRFSARWDAEQQELWVELHEGAVRVQGGRLGEPVLLRAGQRLEVSAASGAFRMAPLAAEIEEPPPLPAPQQAPAVDPARPSLPRARAVAWRTLMERSDFATIVEQAEAMGVERCLSTCSPGNLRILADAARYSGKLDLAEQSLLALRRRSPAQAALAAFFLARLHESRGQSQAALSMYDRHLAEAPRGDYAEQAMAGRMRMLVRLGNTQQARSAARGYLEGFPQGVHAKAARSILGGGASP